ncbi:MULTISPECIES: autotransporter outer membrane beta-barrel domain-containing protein [Enterobacteriaceae]|uniref:autotransporter outer membrane beta-barrel domain-containing protein n=1 Tax=Enterobacteriaceae TaxID=543 RepID=UPI0015DD07E9|nr:autotransporter outer membrane beta-barrel domain-containing protein [Klebsiella sp. WP8-S18-ESBL-06]BBT71719.1 autotransporter [Klebsiella sp. WP8-S18-ESBL-06]
MTFIRKPLAFTVPLALFGISSPIIASDFEVNDGETTSGVIVNSTQIQNVNNGGTSTSTSVNTGGVQNIYDGGMANSSTVTYGKQNVYSGGIANSSLIQGGTLTIDGGTSNDAFMLLGVVNIINGGISNGLTQTGGSTYVANGGIANNTTIHGNNTHMIVNDGGISNNTTIIGRNAARETINSGGISYGTTIYNGGTQYINSGGLANGAIIHDETAQQIVSAGATTHNSIMHNGLITLAGTANNTVIHGGTMEVNRIGIANNTLINNGTLHVFGTSTHTTINGGQSWLYTGGFADGKTEINASGEMLMEAGSHATDVVIQGGTLSITDLTDDTTSYTAAQVDKLTLSDGYVSFLRDSEGDYAALNITELNGTGNFLFNASLAERNANFVTIAHGTGHFGVVVIDSGQEITDHTDLTVNLIHDRGGDIDFSMVTTNGRSTRAVDGGTYMYTLHSAQDKDGLDGGTVWYLGAMTDETDGGDNGGSDGGGNSGGGNLVTTPSTDAILSMANAGMSILRTELDARRVYRTNQNTERKRGEGNVWGHYLGKKSAIDTRNGAAYKLYQNGFVLGGDLNTSFERGDLVTGAYISVSDNHVNHSRGGQSKIDSYGLGLYATWYDNRGFYLDSVMKTNRLGSQLNARMTHGGQASGNWHHYSISSAVEGGIIFKPTESLRIAPFTRITGSHINNANIKLSNGMKAETGKARSFIAEAGTRVGTQLSLGGIAFAPYLSASVEQEFAKSNQTTINGLNRFDNDQNGTSGKYSAGISVSFAQDAAFYGEASYRQGSYIEEPVQGALGIRIGF